jgi:excisionase family DNA binding protein
MTAPETMLYRPAHVAEILGVSVRSVFRMVETGELNAVRIAGARGFRVPRAELERFVSAAKSVEVNSVRTADTQENK